MQALRRLFTEPSVGAAAPSIAGAPSASPASHEPPSRARKRPMLWSAGALSVGVAAVAWWALRPDVPKPVVAAKEPPAAAVRDTGAPVAAAPASMPTVMEPPSQVASGQVVASPLPTPFSVVAALRDIVERADSGIAVSARADKTSLVIGKDSLRFRVRSSQAGYLYVFFGGTDKSHFHLLFPNRIDKANRIEPGNELALPRTSWEISAGGPPGTNHLVMLVSRSERDMSEVGLRQTDEPIPLFDLAQAERLWMQRSRTESPFIGRAICTAPPCPDAFGATMLTIDEVAARRN